MLAKTNMQEVTYVRDGVIIPALTVATSMFYRIIIIKFVLSKFRFTITDSQNHLKRNIYRQN